MTPVMTVTLTNRTGEAVHTGGDFQGFYSGGI